jgi:hypothetical protein
MPLRAALDEKLDHIGRTSRAIRDAETACPQSATEASRHGAGLVFSNSYLTETSSAVVWYDACLRHDRRAMTYVWRRVVMAETTAHGLDSGRNERVDCAGPWERGGGDAHGVRGRWECETLAPRGDASSDQRLRLGTATPTRVGGEAVSDDRTTASSPTGHPALRIRGRRLGE